MREISKILDEVGDVQGGIAMRTISRAIESRQLYQVKKFPEEDRAHRATEVYIHG